MIDATRPAWCTLPPEYHTCGVDCERCAFKAVRPDGSEASGGEGEGMEVTNVDIGDLREWQRRAKAMGVRFSVSDEILDALIGAAERSLEQADRIERAVETAEVALARDLRQEMALARFDVSLMRRILIGDED